MKKIEAIIREERLPLYVMNSAPQVLALSSKRQITLKKVYFNSFSWC